MNPLSGALFDGSELDVLKPACGQRWRCVDPPDVEACNLADAEVHTEPISSPFGITTHNLNPGNWVVGRWNLPLIALADPSNAECRLVPTRRTLCLRGHALYRTAQCS